MPPETQTNLADSLEVFRDSSGDILVESNPIPELKSPKVLTFPEKSPLALVKGRVLLGGEGEVSVDVEGLILDVSLAPSCLLQPEDGDQVLVLQEGETGVILAILQRAQPQALGNLKLPSRSRIKTQELGMETLNLTVVSSETQVTSRAFSLVGVLGIFHFESLSLHVRRFTRQIRHFLSRTLSYRSEAREGLELKGGRVSVQGENVNVDSGSVSIKAKDTAKLDGKTVLLG
ncbi:MAG: DUF3540 domain-containing protein [Deltaproteobacteria bacterium]|jgi:hypothetical protein|nr:DUF3540 domain-containing protein [Deltaproteobacteria bacterium]